MKQFPLSVEPHPNIILVSRPNTINIIYTDEEKQKKKEIIDKTLDFHYKLLNMI
jgi:hypothetical protein